MNSQLEQLRKMTIVVADTGDFEAIQAYQPVDATTNPSLVYQAAQKSAYKHLIESAVHDSKKAQSEEEQKRLLLDLLFVNFGVELLKIVPGRVSTEVDASLSFDTQSTIERAEHLIHLYESKGIPRERVLIKIASTWEGIRAGQVLEMKGIHCNMTLIFSLVQAAACFEAGATLISPFVGRILDWYSKHNPNTNYNGESDPGVQAVRTIYDYNKKFDYKTAVMGASFRNTGEILGLAGCDLLTISPKLLHELDQSSSPFERALSVEKARSKEIHKLPLSESYFKYHFNEDPMAVEKLSEGIRLFAADTQKLLAFVGSLLQKAQ